MHPDLRWRPPAEWAPGIIGAYRMRSVDSTVAPAGLVRALAVGELLGLAVRIANGLRIRCVAGGGPERPLGEGVTPFGEMLPGLAELVELFGGQLQRFQVGAQYRERLTVGWCWSVGRCSG